jgi:hypothetical protein
MATKKNTSAKRTRVSKKRSTTIDGEIRKFDDRMAKLRGLFQWATSNAQTDLSRICYGDLSGQIEDVIGTAAASLKESPVYKLMVEDFEQVGGRFNLLILCARMYLAGKMSPARIDTAIFDAANPPLTPDKI